MFFVLGGAVSWQSWVCPIPISTSPCQLPTCSSMGSTSHWNGKWLLLGSGQGFKTIPRAKAPFAQPLQCLGLAKLRKFSIDLCSTWARHPVFHVTRTSELKIQPHVFRSGSLGMCYQQHPPRAGSPGPAPMCHKGTHVPGHGGEPGCSHSLLQIPFNSSSYSRAGTPQW